MSADLVIRGGTVVDGSGEAGVAADVAVTGGLIEAVGPGLDGAVELDASGCVVAPGFIDIHTHFDAQVFWDPDLKPSSLPRRDHGGGRQLRLLHRALPSRAPRRDRAHARERGGMDAASLTAGIAWDFETFPDYLDLVRRRGTALNFTAYIGHTALRLYVMGDAAYERAATPEEIDRMCQLVGEAMKVGAAGLSTSFSYAHRGADGKPVPSRFAEMDEVEALFMAAGNGRQGGGARHARAGSASTPTSSPGSRASAGLSPARCSPWPTESTGRWSSCTSRRWPGGRTSGRQVTPRPLTMQFTLGRRLQPQCRRGFRRADEGRSPASRKAAYRDPRVAGPGLRRSGGERLRHEATLGDLRGLRVRAVPRAAGPSGQRHRRASAGCSPLDVMCELSLAEDLDTRFRAYIANEDTAEVGRLLTEDHVVLGLTDAGRTSTSCATRPAPTDLLGR